MRARIGLPLSLALLGPFALAGGDDARAQRLELEARAMQSSAKGATDPINAAGFGVLNSANGLVLAAFPINNPSATLATLSGALVWGTSMGVDNAAGQKGALGVDTSSSGFVQVHNSSNTTTVMMDGNRGLVTFSGDVAEAFPTTAATARSAEPGSLMSIDPDRPGGVTLALKPYDRLVVGVVAGARDYRPGLTLRGLAEIQGVALTLTGTTYCLASDANGKVRAGDLLTTSALPGHAMRATDAERSRGAIVGKAMEDLKGSRGLILIVANLQ